MTDWLRENAPDCGDNSCLFGGRGKGGMRTNGGCRCYKDVRPDMRRIYIERLQAALSEIRAPQEAVQELRAAAIEMLQAWNKSESKEGILLSERAKVRQRMDAAIRALKNAAPQASDARPIPGLPFADLKSAYGAAPNRTEIQPEEKK